MLGNLKQEEIRLNNDENKTPRAQPKRRIPYHVRLKVQDALEQIGKENIIERIPENQSTPLVSPIVANGATCFSKFDLTQANH